MDMVATMIHDRQEKNKAQSKIDASEKRARLKEVEAAALQAKIDYLEARIKELEYEK